MLRGAIIGFGAVAEHGHLPGYLSARQAEIVAAVDPSAERRAAARAALPGVATFATVEELAAAVELDFVDICTPPSLHGGAILRALGRGWHVLCEKPLLLDSGELEKVRAAAERAARAIVPVHNWKYAPIVRRATELLRTGAIGRLRAVEIETLRLQDCAVADPAHPNWRRDPALAGGGILMDHGWHAIYLAQHWFAEEPLEIRAVLERGAEQEVEEEATLTLRFPSGPARIFLSWRSAMRRNTMRLVGESGTIVIDDDTLRVRGKAISFPSALSAGSHHADWFEAMLPDVLESFRRPEKAGASFEEAARCLQLIRAAYELA